MKPPRFLARWLALALGVSSLGAFSLAAAIIADSMAEFSGNQGENGWYSGYRDYTTDGGGDDYDAAAVFMEFDASVWTGAAYDLNTEAAAPWTFMGPENVHPNSENNGGEHWCIRRWVASELTGTTALALKWNVRKQGAGGGGGVTGGIWVNGKRVDSAAIAGTDATGVTRTYYLNAVPTDRIDLVLTPVGTSGARDDGSDGSFNWLQIDNSMPEVPRQPDGSIFIPAGAADTDGDGMADFWETVFFPGDLTKLTANGDFDGDGLKDPQEQAKGTDPTKDDSDADGLKDGVETGTGVYVSPSNTGTSPTVPDTDGDGRLDGAEVSGSPTSDPFKVDTDDDGFSDGSEVTSGHDPNNAENNPNTTWIASSLDEFTTSGTQNEGEGWYYGYRNFSKDGGEVNYNPATGFVEFPPEAWTGAQWDLNTAASAPWTELGAQNTHPNGSGNGDTHWTVRRWVANELTKTTPLAIRWHVRKSNVGCGNGVTGALYQNGQLIDKATIAGSDGTGVIRTYYINAQPGDRIDLTLSPRGADGSDADGCDGSNNWMQVDPTIPPDPRQPDGTVFIPAGAGDQDGDGLPDAWEKIYFPNDLTKLTATGDYDQDGLKDTGEYARDSDPTKPDTDGDGLGDAVETATGIFVSATDTGSSPKKVDTDGDGLTDPQEVNGTPQTDPNKSDTDGDGFTDPAEIAWGTDPRNPADSPTSQVIANSEKEFSGVQGQNGWSNGYRNYTLDAKGTDYDAQVDFIAYAGGEGQGDWDGGSQFWTGASWDLNTQAAGPWTYQAALGVHPNGENSPPNEEHWAIRRWAATELTAVTPVAIVWQVRKENAAGGGVTGSLHLNGKQVDKKTIVGTDITGEIRRYYINLKQTDILDLGLTPEGPNDRADGSDGSITWFWVDLRMPKEPRQPDGTLFIPVTAEGVDTDSDGLLDFWELIYAADLTVLSGAGDNDEDGLPNTGEFQRDSNPLDPDTDDDGLSDNVETKTGVFVSKTNTGSNPRKADTDGEGRPDGDEVNGTPTSDPNKPDTDGDGYTDASEVATGHDPNNPNHNPTTTTIGNSQIEFSGVQGQDNWSWGYRNLTTDGGANNYAPETAFIVFPGGEGQGDWDGTTQVWTGTVWDLNTEAAAPWTVLAAEVTHPNGDGNGDWHATGRRWVANELAGDGVPLALRYHVRKTNVGCGNGTTASLHLNGQLLDQFTVAYNDGTGVVRTFYAVVNKGDRIDLILSPRGSAPGVVEFNDWCDESATWLQIDTAIPPNPKQPDGTPFEPGGSKPEITAFGFSAPGAFGLTWSSQAGKTYTIQTSADLKTWADLKTGHPSGGAQTTYTDSLPTPVPAVRYYRVLQP